MSKQKIVIKLGIPNAKNRSKAMQLASKFVGVSKVGITGDGKDRLEVEGEGVDTVRLVNYLRNKVCRSADIVKVEVKDKKDEKKPEEPPYYCWPNYYYCPPPPPPPPLPKTLPTLFSPSLSFHLHSNGGPTRPAKLLVLVSTIFIRYFAILLKYSPPPLPWPPSTLSNSSAPTTTTTRRC